MSSMTLEAQTSCFEPARWRAMMALPCMSRASSSLTLLMQKTSGSTTSERPWKPISSGGVKRSTVKDCRSSLSQVRFSPSRR